MTAPSTLERTRPSDPELDSGEPKEAHIVEKDKVTGAYIEGTPLTALCGKVFVPSRDPKSLPLCPICKEIADMAWGPGSSDGME